MPTSVLRKVDVLNFFPSQQTTTATSADLNPYHTNRTFSAYGSVASGSGSLVVVIEVRNDEISPYMTMATISLTLGTALVADGFVSSAAWKYVRARITTLSGTGASVQVDCGAAPL